MQPNIAGISTPKVRKLAKYFPEKLKNGEPHVGNG
jgi:hypothetical protein